MKNEDNKYNVLLMILALAVVVSFIYLENTIFFFISIIITIFVILFKSWIVKNILR